MTNQDIIDLQRAEINIQKEFPTIFDKSVDFFSESAEIDDLEDQMNLDDDEQDQIITSSFGNISNPSQRLFPDSSLPDFLTKHIQTEYVHLIDPVMQLDIGNTFFFLKFILQRYSS
jgi:hypothetical protein